MSIIHGPNTGITILGRKSEINLTARTVIVPAEFGYTLRPTTDYIDIVYDVLRHALLAGTPAEPPPPHIGDTGDTDAEAVFGVEPIVADLGGSQMVAEVQPGVALNPPGGNPNLNWASSWDYTDPAALPLPGFVPPGIPRAVFSGLSLADLGGMTPIAHQIEANATTLLTNVFDLSHDLGSLLARVVFLTNGRLYPKRNMLSMHAAIGSAVTSSAFNAQYHQVITEFLMLCASRLGLIEGWMPIFVGGGMRDLVFDPRRHLPLIYVERTLDKLTVDTQSLDARALGSLPGPGHVERFVITAAAGIRQLIGSLRMRINLLPRVLETHVFATYFTAKELDIFDWRELDGVVNFFPRATSATPPSQAELTYLAPEVATLADAITGGSMRTPLRRMSADDFIATFRSIEERVPTDDRRPYSLVSIEPRFEIAGRLTATFEAAGFASIGSRNLRTFKRLPHDSVMNYEHLAGTLASTTRDFVDAASFGAAELAASGELIFGGGPTLLFYYAACLADSVRIQVNASAADQLGPDFVGAGLTSVAFRGRVRPDAPYMMAGIRLVTREDNFITNNAATVAVMSARRSAGASAYASEGGAGLAWVVRDDYVSVLAEQPTVYFGSAVSVPGITLDTPANVLVPTASYVASLGPADGVALGQYVPIGVTTCFGDYARLPRLATVRVLWHRGLAMQQYVAAYRLGRILARFAVIAPTLGVLDYWSRVPVEKQVRQLVYDTVLDEGSRIAAQYASTYVAPPLTLNGVEVAFDCKVQHLRSFRRTFLPRSAGLAGAMILLNQASASPGVRANVTRAVYLGL
jgi:hypothetical protein